MVDKVSKNMININYKKWVVNIIFKKKKMFVEDSLSLCHEIHPTAKKNSSRRF
jgi:hypothetical protein